MARRRMRLTWGMAVGAMFAAAPLAAQSTNSVIPPVQTPTPNPTPTPTPSPTPAPAPGNAVGPPQLRDFSLPGTVTRAAPTPPAASAPPATTAPASPEPRPRAATTGEPARPRTGEALAVGRGAPTTPRSQAPSRDIAQAPTPTVETAPPPPIAPVAETAHEPRAAAPDLVPSADQTSGSAKWPWLAALLAVVLGGAFLWWRRQQGAEAGYATARSVGADLPGAEPQPQPQPQPPAPRPAAPPPAPVPEAIAAQRAPQPDGIVTSRLSALPEGFVTSHLSAEPTDVVTARPAPRPDGIVASGLKPQIELELVPVGADADAAMGAVLTVDIVVTNSGSAPARDLLVEAQLINAGTQVDAEIAQFFARQAGMGERVASIPPMGQMRFRTQLSAAAHQLAPLLIDGRRLLVPLVAINAFYHGSGRALKASSSFLVGRGAAANGKLAPFRLDLGPRHWSDLSARVHRHALGA